MIIIDSHTPPATGLAASEEEQPEFRVNIEYRPKDSLTSSQIGNEVARVMRKVDQILESGGD